MVESDSGARLYFRFYDPGTLRTFLPSCSPAQKQNFLSDEILSIVAEARDGSALTFAAQGGA